MNKECEACLAFPSQALVGICSFEKYLPENSTFGRLRGKASFALLFGGGVQGLPCLSVAGFGWNLLF